MAMLNNQMVSPLKFVGYRDYVRLPQERVDGNSEADGNSWVSNDIQHIRAMYIATYVYVCVCVHMHIYIYTHISM